MLMMLTWQLTRERRVTRRWKERRQRQQQQQQKEKKVMHQPTLKALQHPYTYAW
jgi:hypothetical protein